MTVTTYFLEKVSKFSFAHKKGLLHEARKLRATALCHYVSGIATSAPSTAYAVPLPRVARGRLGLQHLSFPRHNGGSGEHSEPIGAFVQQLRLIRYECFAQQVWHLS